MFSNIIYPFRPLFGKDYESFGSAGGKRDMVCLRLPDQSTRGVPAWMFDPVVCSGVKAADKPLIECAALVELSVLLTDHQTNARTGGHEPTRKESCNKAARES